VDRLAVAIDWPASGTVTNTMEPLTVTDCGAESDRSPEVAALPVEVVIAPVIEPGSCAGVRGTLPGWTPVITVAA
jgi:hypothetical protein